MVSPITRVSFQQPAAPVEMTTQVVEKVVTKLPHGSDTHATATQYTTTLDVKPHPNSISRPPQLASVEMAMSHPGMNSAEKFEGISDVQIFRELVRRILQQRSSHHDHALLSHDLALREKDIRKALDAESLRLKEETDNASYWQRVCSWVAWVLNVITLGCLIGTGIAVATTGIAAVGLLNIYTQGLLSLFKAFNMGAKAYTDYARESQEVRMITLKEARQSADSKLKNSMKSRQQAYDAENQLVKLGTHALKSRRKASPTQ